MIDLSLGSRAAVDPAARVSAGVRLGAGVKVGPYAVIEAPAVLGDGCIVDTHAVIRSYVSLGSGCHVHPHAVLGGVPQDTGFDPGLESWVRAGRECVFREGVTVNRATVEGGATRLGDLCFLMNNSHVAHDCTLGDEVVFATNVAIGGFVEIGARAFIGGATVIHQFARVGALAMVSGALGLRKDVLPYTTVAGEPIRHYRLNTVGLRRAGITGDRYRALSRAFRALREGESLDGLPDTAELAVLRDWLAAKSSRGVYGFFKPSG